MKFVPSTFAHNVPVLCTLLPALGPYVYSVSGASPSILFASFLCLVLYLSDTAHSHRWSLVAIHIAIGLHAIAIAFVCGDAWDWMQILIGWGLLTLSSFWCLVQYKSIQRRHAHTVLAMEQVLLSVTPFLCLGPSAHFLEWLFSLSWLSFTVPFSISLTVACTMVSYHWTRNRKSSFFASSTTTHGHVRATFAEALQLTRVVCFALPICCLPWRWIGLAGAPLYIMSLEPANDFARRSECALAAVLVSTAYNVMTVLPLGTILICATVLAVTLFLVITAYRSLPRLFTSEEQLSWNDQPLLQAVLLYSGLSLYFFDAIHYDFLACVFYVIVTGFSLIVSLHMFKVPLVLPYLTHSGLLLFLIHAFYLGVYVSSAPALVSLGLVAFLYVACTSMASSYAPLQLPQNTIFSCYTLQAAIVLFSVSSTGAVMKTAFWFAAAIILLYAASISIVLATRQKLTMSAIAPTFAYFYLAFAVVGATLILSNLLFTVSLSVKFYCLTFHIFVCLGVCCLGHYSSTPTRLLHPHLISAYAVFAVSAMLVFIHVQRPPPALLSTAEPQFIDPTFVTIALSSLVLYFVKPAKGMLLSIRGISRRWTIPIMYFLVVLTLTAASALYSRRPRVLKASNPSVLEGFISERYRMNMTSFIVYCAVQVVCYLLFLLVCLVLSLPLLSKYASSTHDIVVGFRDWVVTAVQHRLRLYTVCSAFAVSAGLFCPVPILADVCFVAAGVIMGTYHIATHSPTQHMQVNVAENRGVQLRVLN